MSDIIKLLPDHIANQIAAGEVIQRPASVIKELLENAIDAGATQIHVQLKQGGKDRIQITDNGCGMTETDARMSFQKHATSKISSADDLFAIRTMGFRGEALASVAAIAQVEVKTRPHDQTLGTLIQIEGMKITRQEAVQCNAGTTFVIKNLFFNVPARRNFLKSDAVELKNCIEEFFRIALAYPQIQFRLSNNDTDLYFLKPGNLKQRIVALFGEEYNQRLVPIEEKTYSCSVSGFCGKPSFAKKTRGEQYLFVNNRFIKSPFIHHAIMSAYENMIAKDVFPFYVLFIEMDPARIDVNVHPQKYEVKFMDEKIVYTFVNLGIKHALGTHSVTPGLDFNQEHHLKSNQTFDSPGWLQSAFQQSSKSENTTVKSTGFQRYNPMGDRDKNNLANWQKLIVQPKEKTENENLNKTTNEQIVTVASGLFSEKEIVEVPVPHQIHRRFIVSQIKSGMLLIDQQLAHERILYEKYSRQLDTHKFVSQQQLFPLTFHLNAEESVLLQEILEDINGLGFDIKEFGGNSFVMHAFPADIHEGNQKQVVEELLQQYADSIQITKLNKREKLALALAKSSGIKSGRALDIEEMKRLIDELFGCAIPEFTAMGKKTFVMLGIEEMDKMFG